MKKLFVVLLAALVLTSVALAAVACDEEETTTTEAAVETETTMAEETTTTEAEPAALTPADVQVMGEQLVADYKADGEVKEDIPTYSAGTVTFEGPVYQVKSKADKFLVVVGDEEASFTLAVFFTDLEALGWDEEALNAMVGMTVEVTGEIVLNPFGGGAEIVVTDATQIAPKM